MFSKIRTKLRSDRGDSTLVSTILVIPLILGILITMIDVSVYFSNRGQMLNLVRDSARQVAIFGGDGTAAYVTPLEYAYGVNRTTACATLNTRPMVSNAFGASSTAIECGLLKNVSNSAGFVSVTVESIQCGAATSAGNFTLSKALLIGSQVGCELEWRYDSIPGSALGFMERLRFDDDGNQMNQRTKVNATSEVSQAGVQCQNWTNGSFVNC